MASPMTTSAEVAGRDRRPLLLAGAVLGSALLLVIGLVVGAGFGTDSEGAPAEGSVDVGFSRDMRDHHAQAVEMSVLVRERTQDPEVQSLALDILLTQQQQVGQMYGWLAAWGVSQRGSGPPMRWMSMKGGQGHGSMSMMPGGAMPGMATDAQLATLTRARGERAERIYLQLMIPHHRAGVMMAKYATGRAQEPQVRRLAQRIVQGQTAELKVLTAMLDDRGGPVAGL